MWEYAVLWIEAAHEDEARRKALDAARRGETDYVTASGDHVRWKVDRVDKVVLFESDTPADGDELFSIFLTDQEATSIQKKIDE